ncbi:MAG: hypothetical protein AAF490_13425 [Chloroflexota bacterium]
MLGKNPTNIRKKIQNRVWGIALISIIIVSLFQLFAASSSIKNNQASANEESNNFLPILLNNAPISDSLPPTPTPSPTEPPPPLELPQIVSFSASQLSVESGQSTDLLWEVTGEIDTIILDHNIGDVTNLTSLTISPTTTSTYNLTVSNEAGSVSEELTITVTEPEPMIPPIINTFTASDSSIEIGESVTISWDVTDFDTLVLNHGGDVTGQTSIEVSPTVDTTYRLRASNQYGDTNAELTVQVTPVNNSNQMEIFDWNGFVYQSDNGFPRDTSPNKNFDWTTPINYAEGTIFVRAEIFSMPVNQPDMYLQLCYWQELNGDNFALETCLNTENVPGVAGTVVCWNQKINQMWKKNNVPLDWTRARHWVAVPIKVEKAINNKTDLYPVSDWVDPEWADEEPADWFPLNMRFTAIVVEEGGTFKGWDDYGGCGSN